MITKVLIGADSLGYEMKQALKQRLTEKGYAVTDFGCKSAEDDTYYPEFAARVCRALLDDPAQTRGVLICGTGLGMTIAANKFEGIYAAHCHDLYSCERSVLSNRANVICFGAQIISADFAWEMLEKWLALEFVDGRSTPKLALLEQIERGNFHNEQ
ncbi:MAG: RpiB/LacA/LacB family sugar-phosphate isomerase [Oscillospiraceae bacterium]|nr:RpiB/LacA/LacB family sugar-phosphate isomerase [Oscillospiraceae bacterium]